MKLRSLGSPALGVLATSISISDVASVTFDTSFVGNLAEVSDREKISVSNEVESGVDDVVAAAETIIAQHSNKWDNDSKKEFLELAKKHALEIISPEENSRFESLKEVRRRDNPARTFAEMKSDIEFHRSVESAIVAIRRLINHDTNHCFPSA